MTIEAMTTSHVHGVVATPAAVDLLTRLVEVHGGVVVHVAGGICAGSDPICQPVGDFRAGQRDACLGQVDLPDPLPPVSVWVAADELAHRRTTGLTLGVANGRGSGFSLEAPEGVRFTAG